MSDLYGRRVVLEVGTRETTGARIEGLRIRAEVRHDRSRSPNEATITVYGVADRSLRLAEDPGAVVRLLAGHDTSGGPRLLFTGSPIRNGVRDEHRGPERMVTIEAQDGGRELLSGRVNVTLGQRTTALQVLDAVAAGLGLPLGEVRLPVSTTTWPHGVTLTGPAARVLDDLAAAIGAQWFVRDGALYVLTSGALTSESVPEFSTRAGNLIGSPTPTKDGVEVTALLEPGMRPGRAFRLVSRSVVGDYVARDVTHDVDSGYESTFYTRITASPR